MSKRISQKEFKTLVKSGKLFKFGTIGCPDKKTYNLLKKKATTMLESKKIGNEEIVNWANIVHLKNTDITAYDIERNKPIYNELTMILVWFKDTKVLGIYYYINKEK